jgi:hypothetical protein
MSVKVRITVTKRYYARPLIGDPAGYYQVVHEDQPGGRYRWEWSEGGEVVDMGPWLPSLPGALRHAATDWDTNAGVVLARDLSRRLRLAAAAYKRSGS